MFALLLVLGCPGGGKSYVCERAAGSPTDRGYVDAPGAAGCGASEVCVSEPGEGGGDCFADVECTIDGLNAGIGISKDCGLDEVCNVPEGAWHGTCETWSMTSETFSGTVDCEAPESVSIPIEQGEVLDFMITFGPLENPGGGANVYANFNDSQGAVMYTGNQLGNFGVVGEELLELPVFHGFQYRDDFSVEMSVFQCAPTPYTLVYDRLSGPVLHTSYERAMPLAKGEKATGIMGCTDQDGGGTDHHLTHHYAIELTAGETIDLTLEVPPDDSGYFSWMWAGLRDANEQEVLFAGNAFGADTALNSTSTMTCTVETSGLYYLWIEQDWSRCYTATEYTVSY